MRHDPRDQRHAERRRKDDERRFEHERRDRSRHSFVPDRVRLAEWIAAAAAAHGVEVLSFEVRRGDELRAVADGIDGPAGTELLVAVLRDFRDRIAGAGFDPTELRIEIDTPGERRELLHARHFERFKGARVRVAFRAAGEPDLLGTLAGAREDRAVVVDALGGEREIDPRVARTIRLE